MQVREVSVQVRPRIWQRDTQPETPALRQVADPLGAKAVRRRYARAWLREEVVADLARRLSRERANLLLVGASGVGKTTVLVDAVREAERLLRESARRGPSEADEETSRPPRHRLFTTAAARIIAGMQYLGEWESRCEEIVFELSEFQGVLCVENLLDLLRVGGSEPAESVAAFLMPYLQQGELRLVGEATRDELTACDRLLPGFSDLFQKVHVEEFSREAMGRLLGQVLDAARQKHDLEAADHLAETILRLHRRFLPYQPFPGPAVQFLRDLIDTAVTEGAETDRKQPSRLSDAGVYAEFARRTGVPEVFLRDDRTLDPDDVYRELAAQVIGQEPACRAAVGVIATFKAGLNDPQRPVGVQLFCGPTGVGKTELAKAISRFCFGSGEERGRTDRRAESRAECRTEDRLFRLDMSEFQDPGAADRLVTQIDGRPSALVAHVRRQPFSVVLLDEIEKAAPEVFDVLLNLFEEGRLSDAFGRATHFQSAIIVMTSNLGATAHFPLGFGPQQEPPYEQAAMRFFRPEFFNRIDEVITFRALSRETVRAIARKELDALNRREGLAERALRVRFTSAVVEMLVARGFDPRYGARPLKRSIETHIVPPISQYLLDHPTLSQTELLLDHDDEHGLRVWAKE
jgi:ATP-dependent Clp protease ATP-binding subunit ClpC